MGKKGQKKKTSQKGAKGGKKGVQKVTQNRSWLGITMEKYDLLLASWIKHRSILQASKDAGVAKSTATKYINVGVPQQGMPSIREQAKKIDQKANALSQLTLAQFRAKYLSQVEEALGTSEIELRLHRVLSQHKAREAAKQRYEVQLDKDGKPVKDADGNLVFQRDEHGDLIPVKVYPSLAFDAQVRAHDHLVRLGERALGAADETLGDAAEENVLAQLTMDEKKDYLLTGKLPIRFRK